MDIGEQAQDAFRTDRMIYITKYEHDGNLRTWHRMLTLWVNDWSAVVRDETLYNRHEHFAIGIKMEAL